MCGRFVGFSTVEQIRSHFGIEKIQAERIRANYNFAPTQQILTVVRQGSERILELMRWGLVPFWAKDPSIGSRLINARSETAAEKPSFKAAFKARRCLIVNDGFYEWKGSKGKKQPVYIKPEGLEGPFAFAGLWDVWRPKNDKSSAPYKSCTILTAEASASVAPIHHRMPVILKPTAYKNWLDPGLNDPAELYRILKESRYLKCENHAVSKDVNSPGSNNPQLIETIF